MGTQPAFDPPDDLPGEFGFSFSFTDCHCSAGIDAALDWITDPTLRDRLATELVDEDDETAHTYLLDEANEVEDDVYYGRREDPDQAEDTVRELREAAACLTWHTSGCACAADAWDLESPYLDDMLDGLGIRIWAVSVAFGAGRRHERIEPADDIDGALTFDQLWDRIGDRNGWESVDVTWDGAQLVALFDGPGGYRVDATPLNAEQSLLWQRWAEANPYDTNAARAIVDADCVGDLADVAASLDLYEALDVTTQIWLDHADLHAAVLRHTEAVRIPGFASVFAALAKAWKGEDGDLLWVSGQLDNIFTTAAAVLTPPVASPAASTAA